MKSRKRKARKSQFSSTPLENYDTISSILLAALSNHGNNPNFQATVKKCLDNLHSHFSKTLNLPLPPEPPLPASILSVLPILLTCRWAEIVCRCAEIVGEASLHSLQLNEQIALDDEIVRALVSGLGSCRRRVSMAACNAVLDLSTTLIGRQRLLEFSGLERLMWPYLQHRFRYLLGIKLLVVLG